MKSTYAVMTPVRKGRGNGPLPSLLALLLLCPALSRAAAAGPAAGSGPDAPPDAPTQLALATGDTMSTSTPAAATAADPGCQATPYTGQPPPGLLGVHADFTPYAGMTIGEVRTARLTVFDESSHRENHLLFRLLNDAHATSRDGTVRRQLLFAPGDALLPRRLAETERNLRQNNYIADARIVPVQVCDGRVDLLVVTRDTWSLEPGASFSHTGGQSNSGFTLKDTNLLGTGHAVAVDFSHSPERDSIDYELDLASLFGTRITTSVHYVDTSDGQIRSLTSALPFYSLDAHWSAGGSFYEESRIDTVTAGTATLARYRHDINHYEAFAGFSPGLQGDFNNRYTLGVAREQDLFEPVDATSPAPPEDRTLNYPWVSYERTENRFAIYRNINYIDRTEDVPLGQHLNVRLGYGSRAFENSIPQWRFSGTFSDAPDVGEHHLLRLEGHVDGSWLSDANRFENTLTGGSVAYHYLQDDRNRWYARLAVDLGSGLTTDHLLSLGGIDDMRGYPRDFERGDRRYVLSLERRYYSSLHLFNLIRVGDVAFVDAGQAWQGDAGFSFKPVYDAGVGLRLSSSKAHTGRVLHMDYAFPLKDTQNIAKAQWLLKVEQSF